MNAVGGHSLRAARSVCTWGLFLVAACARADLPEPRPEHIEPSSVIALTETEVTIVGTGFLVDARISYRDRDRSRVSSAFGAAVGGVALEGVTYIDSSTLGARLPGVFAEGVYDLVITDPAGRTATLRDALTVTPRACEGDGTCTHPCFPDAACVAGECQLGEVGLDVDGDGAIAAMCPGGTDCDDDTTTCGAGCFPGNDGEDRCDGFDHDCDGHIDESLRLSEFFADVDGDGFGDRDAPMPACVAPPHTVSNDRDCDDDDAICGARCFPGNTGVDACDGYDHDCDGQIDEAATTTGLYADDDGDGFGDPSRPITACPPPTGAATEATDCDDANPDVHPSDREGRHGDPECSDGRDNDCDERSDLLDADCALNHAPIARMTITPGAGAPGDTFMGDASASSDVEDALAELVLEWDWNGDGTFDATGPRSSHVYSAAGTFEVRLRATDRGGLEGWASFRITVATGGALVVTTGNDESDVDATPEAPGGAGLSLREAIGYADATAGKQVVLVPSGTTIGVLNRLTTGTDPDGIVIVADGAVIDGSGLAGAGRSCIDLMNDAELYGIEARNCSGYPIWIAGDRVVVARTRVFDAAYAVTIDGSDAVFGPDNELGRGTTSCLWVAGPRARVVGNRLHHCADDAIHVVARATEAVLIRNVAYDNGIGIALGTNVAGLVAWHNTVHASSSAGILIPINARELDVRANILSAGAGFGIDGSPAAFATLEYNAFFGNALMPCSLCVGTGPGTVLDDPQYVDAPNRDLRLDPTSPLIDVAPALGVDVNGPAPGNYSGAAPDIGAFECR